MTVTALVSINHATYGGVYYCANFTTSGAITWTKLTTTGLPSTEITHFRVEYADPLGRQYVKVGNEIYTRTSGNWSKILDLTIAAAAAGQSATNAQISWLYTDPTVAGSVYSLFMTDPAPTQSGIVFALKSTDYGATWNAYQATNGRSRILAIEAIGNNIWCSAGKLIIASSVVCYSPDGGANFYVQQNTAGSSSTASLRINPFAPNKVYAWGDGGVNEWTYSAGFSSRAIPLDTGESRSDRCWFDPVTANRVVYHHGSGLLYSTDNFGTNSNTATSEANPAGIVGPSNVPGSTEFLDGLHSTPNKTVSYYTTPTDAAPDERGGANTGTPPYTDSVPGVASLSMYGIWWGSPPADSGVFVYADELGDITDIPSYTGLGAPLFGDRSSWRDRNVDGFDIYHAEDVERDAREIHTPQPTGNDGYGIKEVGGYWVNTTEALLTSGDLHDPVTLDSDAAILLDLQGGGQEIGLDTQSANTIFAGPASGAANEPTFRAVVAADLGTGTPDGTKFLRDDLTWQSTGSHAHIINEDHSTECNGVTVLFTTALAFQILSTAVYLNGLRQWLGTDYTEAAALTSITLTTAPETGDILIIDYICTVADYAALTDAMLLDSDGVNLLDSDGVQLTDST